MGHKPSVRRGKPLWPEARRWSSRCQRKPTQQGSRIWRASFLAFKHPAFVLAIEITMFCRAHWIPSHCTKRKYSQVRASFCLGQSSLTNQNSTYLRAFRSLMNCWPINTELHHSLKSEWSSPSTPTSLWLQHGLCMFLSQWIILQPCALLDSPDKFKSPHPPTHTLKKWYWVDTTKGQRAPTPKLKYHLVWPWVPY